jgi:chromosome segregation ATPase
MRLSQDLARAEAVKSDLQKLETTIAALGSENSELKAEVISLNKQLKLTRKAANNASHQLEISELLRKRESAQVLVALQETKEAVIAQQEKFEGAMEEAQANAQEKIDEQRREITQLRRQVARLNNQLETQSTTVSILETNLAQAESQQERQQDHCTRLEAELSDIRKAKEVLDKKERHEKLLFNVSKRLSEVRLASSSSPSLLNSSRFDHAHQ